MSKGKFHSSLKPHVSAVGQLLPCMPSGVTHGAQGTTYIILVYDILTLVYLVA